jgi:hypothetical protein
MCTATWLTRADGYELFFNRDERRTRKPARPPTIRDWDGVRFIAPTDTDAGGTWIAVNELGQALALLNYYEADIMPLASPRQFTSRGQLVLDLITQPAFTLPDLTPYRPFLLLALPVPRLWRWNGKQLTNEVPQQPVTTSSFDKANVIRARQARFHEIQGEPFHLTGADAYSVCMTRPDARTVSYSHITVTVEEIDFEYRPRLDDDTGFAEPVRVVYPRQL